MRRLCATAAAFYITKVLPQLSPPLASQHRVTPARDGGNSKQICAAIVSEPPATPLSGRGGANTGRREEGPRRAGPRLKRVWAAAAPQCDCVGGPRWPRWRQPIPLTTIRQDYNWDYRLLILNASLCSLINPKGLSTISLRCSPGVPPSVLLLKSFLLPLLLSRVGGREGTLGQGRLAFRKIPFPLSLFARIPAYKI